MSFIKTKTGLSIILLIGVVVFVTLSSGAFGGTFLGISLKTNANLENGLVAHYSFDGDFEQGMFEFGSGGATSTDPSTSDDFAVGIDVDSSGYVYVMSGSGLCGDTCYYTIKMDPLSGDVVWATTTNPGSPDRASDIAIGSDGYIYALGDRWSSGVSWGYYTYKMDPADGTVIWATTTQPTTLSDRTSAIAVDNKNDVYVTGYCDGCGGKGGDAHYTIKIDGTNGDMLWATSTDPSSSDNEEAQGITTDEAGYVYVTGVCQGCGGVGSDAIYTYKIDPDNGDMLWATSTDFTGVNDEGNAITTDSSGNVYVAAQCWGCGDNGSYSHYTLKIDANNGDMLWATSTDPSPNPDYPWAIASDAAGYIYVTGDCGGCGVTGNDAIYTYKIDPSNGDMIWATTTDPSDGDDQGLAIAIDPDGYVFVTGVASSTASTCSAGGECIYTMKLDPSDGSAVDTTSAGAIASLGRNTPGNIGQGVEFDSEGDYVVSPDSAELSITSELTIAAWVKFNEDPSLTGNYPTLVDKQNDIGGNGYALYYDSGSNFRLGTSGAFIETLKAYDQQGVWYHVVATFHDGNDTAQIYVDGVLDNENTSYTDTLSDTNDRLHIGWVYDANAIPWLGAMDDVRIYSRVLSASEISRLYGLGATTKINKTLKSNPDLENGLLGHWTFDGPDMDLASNTAEILDRSGNGNNGNWIGHSTTTYPGAIGQAIRIGTFDNESYVLLPDFADSISSTTGTISTWVLLNELPDSNDYFFSADGEPGHNPSLKTGANLDVGMFKGSESAGTGNGEGDRNFEVGEWYMVTGVWDETGMRIYWNTERGEYDGGVGYIDPAGDAYIGTFKDTGNYFEDALIDDFRVYDRALSTSSIQRLYQLGATTKIAKTIKSNPDLENGLQAHWTFDGPDVDLSAGAEILDIGPNGYDGTLTGCLTPDSYNFASGKIGQAFDVASSTLDCRAVVNGAHGNFSSTTMSAAAWIYFEDIHTSNFGVFLSQGVSASPGGWIFSVCDADASECSSQSNTLQLYKYWSGADGSWHTDANTIPLREWTHVAFTYDRSSLANDPVLYINGESMNVTEDLTPTGSTEVALQNLEMGSFSGGSGSIFGGLVDDVRIYNRILSAEEILRLYQLGQ